MKKLLLLTLLLGGCTTVYQPIEMKDVVIDNSATNNFVGNPCKFYVGRYCMLVTPRDPNNPYKK
jgi:hypothetical protein